MNDNPTQTKIPVCIEAEQSVLGGLMLDNSKWYEVAEIINYDDFYRKNHAIIFKKISELADNRQPFDILILSKELENEGTINQIGGELYLFELAKMTPTAANVCEYAKIVKEMSNRRKLINFSEEIKDAAITSENPEMLLTSFESTASQIENKENLRIYCSTEAIPKPIPLDNRTLPETPKDIITGWLGDMIEAVMDATETPRELPLAIGLGILATSCQRKCIVEVSATHKEPLNIWTLPTLPSGHRKSAVVKTMAEPLLLCEKEVAEEIIPQIKEAESKFKTIEAKINKIRKDAANKEGLDFNSIQHEIALLEKDLPKIPVVPRLWVQDITPETLGVKMAEQGEKMSIISPEGGLIEIMAGRYNNQGIPNLDIFLQSHAGDSVRVDRMGRDPVFMQNPALTICLSPQPDVLLSLASKREFRGRGLLARFLYFLPKSNLGHRTLQTKPIPSIVKNKYLNNIKSLLDMPESDIPHALTMEQNAYDELISFAHVIEPQLGEGGKFEHISDWGSKLVGAAARIAGLLHCANCANYPEQILTLKISKDTVIKAITLAAICSEHALAAFDLMGADPNINGAKKIWKWIDKNKYLEFTARNCFDVMKGSFKRMNELQLALDVLVERHYIFPRITRNEKKPGRPPSTTYFVSKYITEQWR